MYDQLIGLIVISMYHRCRRLITFYHFFFNLPNHFVSLWERINSMTPL